jgi:hypothetical protein
MSAVKNMAAAGSFVFGPICGILNVVGILISVYYAQK